MANYYDVEFETRTGIKADDIPMQVKKWICSVDWWHAQSIDIGAIADIAERERRTSLDTERVLLMRDGSQIRVYEVNDPESYAVYDTEEKRAEYHRGVTRLIREQIMLDHAVLPGARDGDEWSFAELVEKQQK